MEEIQYPHHGHGASDENQGHQYATSGT